MRGASNNAPPRRQATCTRHGSCLLVAVRAGRAVARLSLTADFVARAAPISLVCGPQVAPALRHAHPHICLYERPCFPAHSRRSAGVAAVTLSAFTRPARRNCAGAEKKVGPPVRLAPSLRSVTRPNGRDGLFALRAHHIFPSRGPFIAKAPRRGGKVFGGFMLVFFLENIIDWFLSRIVWCDCGRTVFARKCAGRFRPEMVCPSCGQIW